MGDENPKSLKDPLRCFPSAPNLTRDLESFGVVDLPCLNLEHGEKQWLQFFSAMMGVVRRLGQRENEQSAFEIFGDLTL